MSMETDVYLECEGDRMVVVMDRPVTETEQWAVRKLTGWKMVAQGGHYRSFNELQRGGYTGRLGPGADSPPIA